MYYIHIFQFSVKSFLIEQDVLQKGTDGTSKSLPTTKPIKKESDVIKKEEIIETESEIKVQNSEKGSTETKDEDGKNDVKTEDEDGKNDEKKSKRKRKRKNHEDSSRNNNSGGDLLSELQIMPRTEWKRLRNKYLNLQRKNMAHR